MNKAMLVEKIQSEHGDMTKAQAERLVDTIFKSIVEETSKGETVSIAGFGVFCTKERSARMGRNPRTGESMQIKASTAPKFRPSKLYKDTVNK